MDLYVAGEDFPGIDALREASSATIRLASLLKYGMEFIFAWVNDRAFRLEEEGIPFPPYRFNAAFVQVYQGQLEGCFPAGIADVQSNLDFAGLAAMKGVMDIEIKRKSL